MSNICSEKDVYKMVKVMVTILLLLSSLFLMSIEGRDLKKQQKGARDNNSNNISQDMRSPVPPSKPSPCTYIPGYKGGHCQSP